MRGKSHLIIGTLASIEFALLSNIAITPINILCSSFLSCAADIDESNSNILNTFIKRKSTKKVYNLLLLTAIILLAYAYKNSSNNMYIGYILTLGTVVLIRKFFTETLFRTVVVSATMFLISITMLLFNYNHGITGLMFLLSMFPLFKHRGFTHSLLMPIILFIILKYIEEVTSVSNISVMGTFAYVIHLCSDIITKRGIPIFYPLSKKYTSLAGFKVGGFLLNTLEYIIIILLVISIIVTIIYNRPLINLY